MIVLPCDSWEKDCAICDPNYDPDCNKEGEDDPSDSDSKKSETSDSQTSDSDSESDDEVKPCPKNDPDCHKPSSGECHGPECLSKRANDICPDSDPDCDKQKVIGNCSPSDPDCNKVKGGVAVATELVELIDGFILGALDTERLTSVETCAADFDPLVLDMVTAVQ